MWNAVPAHRHHDISDETWTLLEPHLPGREGVWGGIAKDNRLLINAVFWLLRTGAPWRELPPDHGGWSNTHRRFIRWRDKGIWEKLLDILIDEPDYEWLMIDASHCKVHPHAAGAKGGNVDAHGLPVRIVITEGPRANCTRAGRLIEILRPRIARSERLRN